MNKLWQIAGVATLLLLAGCGNQTASQQTSSSSQSSSVSSSSSVASSSSATSSSATNSSSAAQSSSTATTTNNSGVNDKQIGVMVAFLTMPNWFKQNLDGMYYQPASLTTHSRGTAVRNYSYVSQMGDPTSFIYYQVNGENVNIKLWELSAQGGVADGHWKNETVSIDRLKNDYYVNQSQKDEVNSDANQLKSAQQFMNAHKND
ncbi:hypothetical protein MOO44_08520 [Nicoliella spurrieriana]|uniref:Lreu-0056-like domain-containing protein n=1 Tax=Nicoliella spurrieriana TaxID=2925830 RepID=A0A976X5B9_9LACO|nr:hypothetical protein [Nicoliella spurrieriana]UQS86893.1 hypothetical protein MOO44_08520 [Nicoliella spurrieriana]